jgi:hypothetical protein
VSFITNTRPSNGERDVLPNAFVEAHVNPGQALDPESIDASTVKLFRTKDKQLIPSNINVSAAGDTITLTPAQMLDPGTQYTFEVRGVKDLSDANVMPFDMTFTTSGGNTATTYPWALRRPTCPATRTTTRA